MGQVAHALLTRPPLSFRSRTPEGVCFLSSVRLACVKHAASVHPEPGSNSHVIILQDLLLYVLHANLSGQNQAWLSFSRFFTVLGRFYLLAAILLTD